MKREYNEIDSIKENLKELKDEAKKAPVVAQATLLVFATREMARAYCRANNKSQASIKKVNGIWTI